MSDVFSLRRALASLEESTARMVDVFASPGALTVHGVSLVPFRGTPEHATTIDLVEIPPSDWLEATICGASRYEFYVPGEDRFLDRYCRSQQDGRESLTMAVVARVSPPLAERIASVNVAKADVEQAMDALRASYADASAAESVLGDVIGRRVSRRQLLRRLHVVLEPRHVGFFWSAQDTVSRLMPMAGYVEMLEEKLEAAGILPGEVAPAGSIESGLQADLDRVRRYDGDSTVVRFCRRKPPQLTANVADAVIAAEREAGGRRRYRKITGSCPIFYQGDDVPSISWPVPYVESDVLNRPEDRWSRKDGAARGRGKGRARRNKRQYVSATYTAQFAGSSGNPVYLCPPDVTFPDANQRGARDD